MAIENQHAELMLRRGEELLATRSLEAAVECLDEAERMGADPDRCAGARWRAWMLLGEMERAWRESDAIRARGAADPHRFWQGEPLAGQRVIVRCLHGFGDTVQMLRYLPRLRAQAASAVVEVDPRMMKLARCFDGVDEVITWGEDAPAQPPLWEVQIEVMELPYLFRTHAADLPLAVNYLHVRPCGIARKGLLRVGVVTTAGDWNPGRSLPIERLQPLLNTPGCAFVSLDHGPVPAWTGLDPDLQSAAERSRESIVGLAEVIAGLDLIVTVDTLAAHLAGALGIQAWVLLQHAADWRWMHGRDASPWYPTVRLFRQDAAGAWVTVVERLCKELVDLSVHPTSKGALQHECA